MLSHTSTRVLITKYISFSSFFLELRLFFIAKCIAQFIPNVSQIEETDLQVNVAFKYTYRWQIPNRKRHHQWHRRFRKQPCAECRPNNRARASLNYLPCLWQILDLHSVLSDDSYLLQKVSAKKTIT